MVQENSKWGLLSPSGEKITAPKYDSIRTSGPVYIAKLENYYGIIDQSAKIILPFEYESIHDYSSKNETGIVKKNGQWAFLEKGNLSFEKEKIVFTIPDRFPMFKKCPEVSQNYKELKSCADKKLLEYIYQKINYPSKAVDAKIEGMVVISFIVTDEGKVEDITILRDIGGGCGEAAKKIFEDMEPWIPGTHDGQNIYCRFNIPVKFKL